MLSHYLRYLPWNCWLSFWLQNDKKCKTFHTFLNYIYDPFSRISNPVTDVDHAVQNSIIKELASCTKSDKQTLLLPGQKICKILDQLRCSCSMRSTSLVLSLNKASAWTHCKVTWGECLFILCEDGKAKQDFCLHVFSVIGSCYCFPFSWIIGLILDGKVQFIL